MLDAPIIMLEVTLLFIYVPVESQVKSVLACLYRTKKRFAKPLPNVFYLTFRYNCLHSSLEMQLFTLGQAIHINSVFIL